MKRSAIVVAMSAVVVIAAIGCKSAKNDTPAPVPQAQPSAAAPQAGNALSGKVAETMNSGGYTYISLENNGTKTWVAVPEAKVAVGQMVSCQPGMPMKDFTSKTLNRSFPVIIFSGGVL
jgi:major membrane immunogen (membrane-anchored lipoprotein)